MVKYLSFHNSSLALRYFSACLATHKKPHIRIWWFFTLFWFFWAPHFQQLKKVQNHFSFCIFLLFILLSRWWILAGKKKTRSVYSWWNWTCFHPSLGPKLFLKTMNPEGLVIWRTNFPTGNTSKSTLKNGSGTGTSVGWLLSFDRGYQPGYQVGY